MAAIKVINPVMSQTAIIQPALPTFRVMSALTIKIPEPIIEPATIIVASSKPSEGLNPCEVSGISSWFVLSIINKILNSFNVQDSR
jgi:hypothetical protein